MNKNLSPELMKRVNAATEIVCGGRSCEQFWEASFQEFSEKMAGGLIRYFPEIEKFVADKPFGDVAVRESYWQSPSVESEWANGMVSSMSLFGLHGPIACGKDTAADRLQDSHGFGRLAFADPLRSAASVLFCIPQEIFTDRETKDREYPSIPCSPHSPRRMLQLFGTEICREIDQNVWTKRATLSMIGLAASGVKNIAITDVRFPNESEYIRNLGGRLIVIDRPDIREDNIVFGAGHASQQSLPMADGDLSLLNDKDIPSYWIRVDEMRAKDLSMRASDRQDKKDRPRP